MAEQPSTSDDEAALDLPPVIPDEKNFESDEEGDCPLPRHIVHRAGGTGG